MIDGVSSNYFTDFPQFMPHTHALAKNGIVLTDLAPEKCASSLPGRTSILTGQPSRNHGIYGNTIWDPVEKSFRYSSPYDIRIPTIFFHAKQAGLDTASLGFGMTRPQDCRLYKPPHWVGDFVSRNRDDQPLAVSEHWKEALNSVDDGRLEAAQCRLPSLAKSQNESVNSIFSEMILDQQMIQLVNALVHSPRPPDLIFTEINVTDTVQHRYGYASNQSNFSIAHADMLVGLVVHSLQQAGLDENYSLIVTSDHGHADTHGALYVNNILHQQNWSSECAVLFLEHGKDIDESVDALGAHGPHLIDDEFLPDNIRGQILPLAIKDKISLEMAPTGCSALNGPSKYRSSHSYYPLTKTDNRFAVVSGSKPGCDHIKHATCEQFFELMCEKIDLKP